MSEAFSKVELGSLCAFIKDGTHGTHPRVSEGVPLLSAKNISAAGTVDFDESDDLISEKEYELLAKSFSLKKGDVLLTVVGSLGRAAIFNGEKVAFQRSVAFLRPEEKKLFPRFLFHVVRHDAFKKQLVQRSNATAQAGIYLGELSRCKVPGFYLGEQKTIANILDTLDTQIRQTETIIAKLQQVKQGLLHDLLTRGIDANGQLRPPRDQAPELYKESPLGWIPREWDGGVLDDYSLAIGDGIHATPIYSDFGDYYFVNGNNLFNGEIRITDATLSVDEREYRNHFIELDESTLLYSINGTIGNIAIYNGERIILGKSAAYIRCKKEADARFLYWVMQTERTRSFYRKEMTGSTISNLSLKTLRSTPVGIPSVEDEKLRIVSIINQEETRIQKEKDKLQKVKRQKSGLMDDLLTGRVRVTSLLDTAKAS